MKAFSAIGSSVERAWREANYDDSVFAAICAEALKEARLPELVRAWDVLEWAVGADVLPAQQDPHASFGEPPVTVFNGSRFYIDVYFWFEGTTTIHEHGFSGAFQVLHGSSIHSWYEFANRRTVNGAMRFGDLTLKTCELLSVGDIQPIPAGSGYIHSLFHLDHPSATVVIRTGQLPDHQPQFEYKKPTLAVNPFFEDRQTLKKLQCVFAYLRDRHPDAERVIADWLSKSDLHTAFQILVNIRDRFQADQAAALFGAAPERSGFDRMFDVVAERHGEWAQELRAVFENQTRIEAIIRRRAAVTNPELRFFLALMLNVEGRGRILDLIRTRYPEEDPVGKVLDWTFDLAQTRVHGSPEPNAIGIADFDDLDLLILEAMLDDPEFGSVRRRIAEEFGQGEAAAASSKIEAKYGRILGSPIFKPLFSNNPSAS